MDELNTLLAESLDKYFKVLKKEGYKSYGDVYNLIALCAIHQIIYAYGDFLTEEDMRYISKAMYCIGGNCLIDFPSYLSEDTIFHKDRIERILRSSEIDFIRTSEDSIYRIKE